MLRNKGMKFLAVALALLTTTAATAADCRKKVALQPAALGITLDASGTIEARAAGTKERFKVSIDARVPDGTTYVVLVNGMIAGTITVSLGAGELQLETNDNKAMPSAVASVCTIGSVAVIEPQGTPLLTGAF